MELSGYGSDETPNSSEGVVWAGLCCIVIKASQILQSSPVAQLVLVLVTKHIVSPDSLEAVRQNHSKGK